MKKKFLCRIGLHATYQDVTIYKQKAGKEVWMQNFTSKKCNYCDWDPDKERREAFENLVNYKFKS